MVDNETVFGGYETLFAAGAFAKIVSLPHLIGVF